MAGHTVTISVLAQTSQFSRSMKGLSGVVGKMGKGLVAGAAVAGGAAVALIGSAVKKGLTRAMDIQDAKKKLEGIGHSAKSIAGITNDALGSVRGTAFSMGDAMKVAAGTVAAGIKPGQQLQRTLKLTANAAALAGVGMGEMGSILNKVWTSGKVQTDELNQLADRGIPIWANLAKQYGVTQEELRKMVSSGKVDAKTFADVLEKTVGNSATKAGETTRGALKNLSAAWGRLGAQFASPVIDKAPGLLNSISGAIDKIGAALKPVSDAFGKWLGPQMEKLAGFIDKLDLSKLGDAGGIIKLMQALTPFGILIKAIQPILPQLQASFTQIGAALSASLGAILPMVLPLLDQLAAVVGQLIAALLPPLASVLMSVLAAVTPLIPPLMTLAGSVLATLAGILPTVANLLSVVANVVGSVLMAVMPALLAILAAVNQLWQATAPLINLVAQVIVILVQALAPLIVAIANLVGAILPPLVSLLSVVAIWIVKAAEAVLNFLMPAFKWIGDAIAWLAGPLQGLADWFGKTFPTNVQTGMGTAQTAVSTGVQGMAGTLGTGMPAFNVGGQDLMSGLATGIDAGGPLATGALNSQTSGLEKNLAKFGKTHGGTAAGRALMDNVAQGIKTGGARAKTSFAGVQTNITGDLSKLGKLPAAKTAGSDMFGKVGDGFKTGGKKASTIAKNTAQDAAKAVRSAHGAFVGAGAHLVDGLVSGINSRKGAAVAAARSLAAAVEAAAKAKAEIQSPSRVFARIGRHIVDGLRKGIADNASKASSAIGRVIALVNRTATKASADLADRINKKSSAQFKAAIAAQQKALKAAARNTKALLEKQRNVTGSVWGDGDENGKVLDRILRSLNTKGVWTKSASKTFKKMTLADISQAREVMKDRISEQQKLIDDMRQQYNQLRDSVADGITDSFQLQGVRTIGQLKTTLSGMVGKAKAFAGKIKSLIKRGYPAALVQQVAGLGFGEGARVADVLLSATDTEIAEINKDYSALTGWATDAGKAVADQMYAAGIAAQEGLLRGLEKDLRKLDKAAERLVNALVKAVKDKLKIKSPSRVMEAIGKFLPLGLAKGIDAEADQAENAMGRLAGRLGIGDGFEAHLVLDTVRHGGTANVYSFDGVTFTASTPEEAALFEQFVAMIRRKTKAGV